MMDDIAIEMKGICKTYAVNDAKFTALFNKDKRAHVTEVLKGIDLTVKKGDILGIIGRNGCGKTTLMRIMAGMTEQTSGTLNINGKMVCIIESGTLFLNDNTGYENIIYRGRLYGMTKAEILSKMDDIVRYAELGDAVDKPVRTYSLGMRSRLGFSIMAHVDADVYILDEALNAGDSIFSGKAIKFLNQLSMKGKTVVMTSHSGNILKNVCNRAILVEEGVIIADAHYPEIAAKYRRTLMASAKTMEEAAESDNPSVQYALAKIKQATDPKEYEQLLKNAAEGRNNEAMVEYGDILVDRGEIEAATEYYRMAAKAGDENGKIRYAVTVTHMNDWKQPNLVKTYANKGDHFDEYRYGMLLKGLSSGVSRCNAAYSMLNTAYEHGNCNAGYEIALMKIIGNGTVLDMDGAIRILQDNAMKGHMRSAKRLYELYSDGKYIDPDITEAFKWCEKTALMGDSKSQFALAMMYKEGIGTEKDEAKSDEWMISYICSIGASNMLDVADHMKNSAIYTDLDENYMHTAAMMGYNDRGTRMVLDNAFLKMTKEDHDSIFRECKKYCTTGRLMKHLAKCYLEGIGVECDEKEAFRLYTIAANAGDAESMYILARMYKNGIGTEQDIGQYTRWVRLASREGQFNASMITKKKDQELEERIRRAKSKLKE